MSKPRFFPGGAPAARGDLRRGAVALRMPVLLHRPRTQLPVKNLQAAGENCTRGIVCGGMYAGIQLGRPAPGSEGRPQ